MIELNSPETKNKLMNHVVVASWFKSLHNEIPEVEHSSDDVSTKGEADNAVKGSGLHNDGEESDTEAVSDTYFGDNVVNVDNAEVQG
nr:hypothetical protein [Tanacetum cinerariifolium]